MTIKNTYRYTFGKTNLVFVETDLGGLKLIHFSPDEYDENKLISEELLAASTVVELHITGLNQPNHKGGKLGNTLVGRLLRLKKIERHGNTLNIVQVFLQDQIELEIETTISCESDTEVFRWQNKLTNYGETVGLEYITSLNMIALNQTPIFHPFTEDVLYQPHNAWQGELQWQESTLKELGLDYRLDGEKMQDSTKVIESTNRSSWSCSQQSPFAILHSPEQNRTSFWQIEHNGEWHWELSDCGFGEYLSLRVTGPTGPHNHWWKKIVKGDTFETITVSFGTITGSFTEAIRELNTYRRRIRRVNRDNQDCPVIFNDYMNCLMGDPTTEKELPMIDRAAEVGCEYYVVDCGWYSDGYWWDNVGEWLPSTARFPEGIAYLMTRIRKQKMIPGLWLEIEVMGINSQFANSLPDNWFICRNGQRVKDHSRYHLDFRNPHVQEYASSIVDRLVKEYQVGYIKMDYNTPVNTGSDLETDSLSDSLLSHNQAYLTWLDGVFESYPELIIENCGSGGMRHDYAMLARHSIQSVTDQTDYLRNGAIAAVCATAVTPEQSAIWSYPLKDGNREEVIFNMVNSLLFRIHQSGHLAALNDEGVALVKEAIGVYQEIRSDIPIGQPIWPRGLPHLDDDWFTFGLETDKEIYLAVWRTTSLKNTYSFPLATAVSSLEQIYPRKEDTKAQGVLRGNQLTFRFDADKMARLYRLEK